MSFLLHVDAVFAFFQKKRLVIDRLQQHQRSLFFAAPTILPLELWLKRPKTPSRYLLAYLPFLSQFQIVDLTEPIAHRAEVISGTLTRQNQKLRPIDLFVAATAVERGLILVTHDTAVFAAVPGLTLVNWVVP